MEQTLSEMLKLRAAELEREMEEESSPEERQEMRSTRRFASQLAEYIVLSRQVLSSDGLTQIDSFVKQEEDSVRHVLDEYYVLRQIDKVPSMVDRTLRFSRLNALRTPSPQTNRYLSEAMRAYIQGFSVASAAIARSALEQAFKERLGRQGDGVHHEFGNLVAEASHSRMISKTGAKAARDLAIKCNVVLHEAPFEDDKKALEILDGVRSVIEELYSTPKPGAPS